MPLNFTHLARVKHKRRPVQALEFWKKIIGLNKSVPPTMLGPGEFAELLNFKINRFGILESRPGLTRVSSATTTSASAIETIAYIPIGSTTYIFLVDANYQLYCCSGSEPTIDPGSTLGTLDGAAMLVPFNGKCVILDGGYIKYTDGSTIYLAYDDGEGTSAYQYNNTCATLATAGDIKLYSGGNTRCGGKQTTYSWGGSLTIPITQIDVWLSKTGSPTGNVTGKLYNADGSSLLATSDTTLDSTTLTTNATLKSFEFDGSVGMSPNTAYIFAVEYSGGDASNYVTVHSENVGSGGDQYYYDGSWHAVATYDVAFGFKPDVPPKGSFGDVKGTRLFVGGDPDNPGYLWFSNVNTLTDWSTADGGGYVSAVDDNANSFPVGGVVAHYGDLYVLGKQQQPYICKLTGSSPSSYELPPLFQQGYTDHKTMFSVGNDIWFASGESLHNIFGVQEYGDIRTYSAGDPVKHLIQSYFSTSAFAGYNPKDGQVLLKLDGYDNILVCHVAQPYRGRKIVRYPWSEYKFKGYTPTAFASFNNEFYVGCDDGHLYRLDDTEIEDNGTQPDLWLASGFTEFPFTTINVTELYLTMTSPDEDADGSLTIYTNGKNVELDTIAVSVLKRPTEYKVSFNANSVRLDLHSITYTNPIRIQGIVLKARSLAIRDGVSDAETGAVRRGHVGVVDRDGVTIHKR